VGGVVAAGEDWDLAARREVLEEIGVAAKPEFLFDFRYDGVYAMAFGRVYRIAHEGPFRLQPEEVAEAQFIDEGRLPALFTSRRFCPDGVAVWEEFRRRVSGEEAGP